MSDYQFYQVGGCLTGNAPSYVERKADPDLYNALKSGEFCYILNSPQMGKSSLLVKVSHRLQLEGVRCVCLDITNIGCKNITVAQWYKGIIAELCLGFELFERINFKTWWQAQENLLLPQRLSHFISEVLLVQFPNDKLLIIIDEIDSIKSLDFSVDDFFALIRFCYNQRAINPEYHRLTFALAGVATPSDLIQDPQRTPFNIGRAIELDGFEFDEAIVLLQGLSLRSGDAHAVLKAILTWTGGQPFLTQKLCQIIQSTKMIPPGTEAFWIESVVRSSIIHQWQSQDNPEHLRTISTSLLGNPQYAVRLLTLYQQLLQGAKIPINGSQVQTELLLSGFLIAPPGLLKVKNPIYAAVFNLDWMQRQLAALRFYSQTFDAWIAFHQQDESQEKFL